MDLRTYGYAVSKSRSGFLKNDASKSGLVTVLGTLAVLRIL